MTAVIRARISHEVENAQRSLADADPTARQQSLLRRDTLRMAQNALYLAEKHDKRPLCDDQALEVLFREVRQRIELEAAFRLDNQIKMAEREAAEIAVLCEFLPPPLSEEELSSLIAEGIAATGARVPRDAHRVMNHLSPGLRGRADLHTTAKEVHLRLSVGPASKGQAPRLPDFESPGLSD
jgi:uncharacterized protein YqeY